MFKPLKKKLNVFFLRTVADFRLYYPCGDIWTPHTYRFNDLCLCLLCEPLLVLVPQVLSQLDIVVPLQLLVSMFSDGVNSLKELANQKRARAADLSGNTGARRVTQRWPASACSSPGQKWPAFSTSLKISRYAILSPNLRFSLLSACFLSISTSFAGSTLFW